MRNDSKNRTIVKIQIQSEIKRTFACEKGASHAIHANLQKKIAPTYVIAHIGFHISRKSNIFVKFIKTFFIAIQFQLSVDLHGYVLFILYNGAPG